MLNYYGKHLIHMAFSAFKILLRRRQLFKRIQESKQRSLANTYLQKLLICYKTKIESRDQRKETIKDQHIKGIKHKYFKCFQMCFKIKFIRRNKVREIHRLTDQGVYTGKEIY